MVFTSLGFYPVTPGSNQYVLGRPFVDRSVLHLPNGKTFTVRATGLSESNAFVRDVRLNGKPLNRSFVTHEELMGGGELEFVMSTEPEAAWSRSKLGLPYSMTK